LVGEPERKRIGHRDLLSLGDHALKSSVKIQLKHIRIFIPFF
jgi:hypothetical protein